MPPCPTVNFLPNATISFCPFFTCQESQKPVKKTRQKVHPWKGTPVDGAPAWVCIVCGQLLVQWGEEVGWKTSKVTASIPGLCRTDAHINGWRPAGLAWQWVRLNRCNRNHSNLVWSPLWCRKWWKKWIWSLVCSVGWFPVTGNYLSKSNTTRTIIPILSVLHHNCIFFSVIFYFVQHQCLHFWLGWGEG